MLDTKLFRPPYGRIKRSQAKLLKEAKPGLEIIMWSVLSGDFDKDLSPQKCLDNVLKNTKSGDIVLFHDSLKAKDRMEYALPRAMEYWSNKGVSSLSLHYSNNLSLCFKINLLLFLNAGWRSCHKLDTRSVHTGWARSHLHVRLLRDCNPLYSSIKIAHREIQIAYSKTVPCRDLPKAWGDIPEPLPSTMLYCFWSSTSLTAC